MSVRLTKMSIRKSQILLDIPVSRTYYRSNIIENLNEFNLTGKFKPSTRSMIRIIQSISNDGSQGKTNLANNLNLNYARLTKHVVWMENRGLVVSIIYDSKIKIDLTEKGRSFVGLIS